MKRTLPLDPATLRWVVRSLKARAAVHKRWARVARLKDMQDAHTTTRDALRCEADRIDRLVTRIERKAKS